MSQATQHRQLTMTSLLRSLFSGPRPAEPATPPAPVSPPPPAPAAHPISATLTPENRPEFRRTYVQRLDARCVITVSIREWTYGLSTSAELTQPNGNTVWFDPDRIADKILDPTLVPLVAKAVQQIYGLDREFRASNPAEFKDDRGVMWRRADVTKGP